MAASALLHFVVGQGWGGHMAGFGEQPCKCQLSELRHMPTIVAVRGACKQLAHACSPAIHLWQLAKAGCRSSGLALVRKA